MLYEAAQAASATHALASATWACATCLALSPARTHPAWHVSWACMYGTCTGGRAARSRQVHVAQRHLVQRCVGRVGRFICPCSRPGAQQGSLACGSLRQRHPAASGTTAVPLRGNCARMPGHKACLPGPLCYRYTYTCEPTRNVLRRAECAVGLVGTYRGPPCTAAPACCRRVAGRLHARRRHAAGARRLCPLPRHVVPGPEARAGPGGVPQRRHVRRVSGAAAWGGRGREGRWQVRCIRR